MPILAISVFKRIIFDDWIMVAVITSFVMVGGIFLMGSIRALLLPKATREHLANLPLEGEAPDPSAATTDLPPLPPKP